MGTVSRHNPRLQECCRGSLQPCHPPKCWEGTKGGRSLPLHHRGAGVGGMGAAGSAGPPEALRSPSLQHLHAAGTGDTGSAGSAGSLRACRSPPCGGAGLSCSSGASADWGRAGSGSPEPNAALKSQNCCHRQKCPTAWRLAGEGEALPQVPTD